MGELERTREAIEEALDDLDSVVSGRRPPTADRIVKALHALLRSQLAVVDHLRGPEKTLDVIDPDDLTDDDDVPTLMLDDVMAGALVGRSDGSKPIHPDSLREEGESTTMMFLDAQTRTKRASAVAAAPPSTRDRSNRATEGAGPAVSTLALSRFELVEILKWLDTGTLFQMRGDLAYVNVSSTKNLKIDVPQKMAELGFSSPLGILEDDGLEHEVMLFQRPS